VLLAVPLQLAAQAAPLLLPAAATSLKTLPVDGITLQC
jgi:hypothetical protein